jgi:hypothetical protein
LSQSLDAEERELRMAVMRADLANKQADTDYKRGLLRYEPWKVVTTAFGAGFALCGGLVALLTFIFARMH